MALRMPRPEMTVLQFLSQRSDIYTIRFCLLCFAMIFYGMYGFPTPDQPGLVEVVLAALLFSAVSFSGLWKAVVFDFQGPLWFVAGQVYLIFALTVPFLIGIASGHAFWSVFRDLVPFLFMMLPVFLRDTLQGSSSKGSFLIGSLVALGVLLALRSLQDVPLFSPLHLFLGGSTRLDYLANMPTVLFSALLFTGLALERIMGVWTGRSVLWGALYGLLGFVCLWPIVLSDQRASVGVFTLGLAYFFAMHLWHKPYRTLCVLSVFLAVLGVFIGDVSEVISTLLRKQALVGSNMRFQEIGAVWDNLRGGVLTIVLGRGWGGQLASPAVAGIVVNYTHGFFSSMLFKTGVLGLMCGLWYVGTLCAGVFELLKKAPVVAIAILGPVFIDVFLYASFKSLDFGFLLLLGVFVSRIEAQPALGHEPCN